MWCLRMGQGRFGFLETRCLLYNFPSCYDGIPDKELRKKDFVWAHGLWVQSPPRQGRDGSKQGRRQLAPFLQTGNREE